MNLVDFVLTHAERGECTCGLCCDGGSNQPEGHTVDMIFFKVAAKNNPSKEEFLELTSKHSGDFCNIDPLDGKEHSYLELGAWIGDQGLAMQYMALAELLGVGKVFTPKKFINDNDLVMKLAQAGLITMKGKNGIL